MNCIGWPGEFRLGGSAAELGSEGCEIVSFDKSNGGTIGLVGGSGERVSSVSSSRSPIDGVGLPGLAFDDNGEGIRTDATHPPRSPPDESAVPSTAPGATGITGCVSALLPSTVGGTVRGRSEREASKSV